MRLPLRVLPLLVSVMVAGAVATPRGAVAPVDEVIQTELNFPWDIAFPPDGRMFVTERPGNFIIFASAAPGAPRLATIPISGVHAEGESGLMGLDLDPDFAANGYVYLCVSMTKANGGIRSCATRWLEMT